MNETSRKGQETKTEDLAENGKKSPTNSAATIAPEPAEQTKANAVAPRDRNSVGGIHPMPIRTMHDLGDGRWIDASIIESGSIAIAHCGARDTTHRILSSTDAIDHAKNIFRVATTALHEQSPALAEQFARAFAQELLALADQIGVAAMTPEDRRQKALDER